MGADNRDPLDYYLLPGLAAGYQRTRLAEENGVFLRYLSIGHARFLLWHGPANNDSGGSNEVLNLVLACGYLSKLFGNARCALFGAAHSEMGELRAVLEKSNAQELESAELVRPESAYPPSQVHGCCMISRRTESRANTHR